MNDQVFYHRSSATIIDFVRQDGRGQYSGHTQAEIQAEFKGPIETMSWDEARKLHNEAAKKPPVEISQEDFWHYLEVLPPQAWVRLQDSESFHMMEFQTGDITRHLVRIGKRYFKLDDNFRMKHFQLVEMCKHILDIPQPTLESKMS